MKHYDTYLFDFDYTLADSSRGIVMCYRRVIEANGFRPVSDDAIKRTIGLTLEDGFSALTGVTDRDVLARLRAEYVAEADKCMTANTRLFPETAEVLGRLRQRGARLGIISTKYAYRISEFLGLHLPPDTIDIIVGLESVKAAKPSPEGVLHAMTTLGARPESTLYVGDSTVDAATARAADIDFAGVLHGVTTSEELAAYPHVAIMHTLGELL